MDITTLNKQVQQESIFLQDLKREVGKVIVGQEALLEKMLVALLADGHILIEGVPGLAKTLAVKTLRKPFTPSSSASNLPRIYCLPISRVHLFLTPKTAYFIPNAGLCFPTLCWPMKSTAPRPRFKARYWKPCRSAK